MNNDKQKSYINLEKLNYIQQKSNYLMERIAAKLLIRKILIKLIRNEKT